MKLSAGILEIDVHGMTKLQAVALIDARLKQANRGVYRLRIIHGYHGGTQIRDEVRRRYRTSQSFKDRGRAKPRTDGSRVKRIVLKIFIFKMKKALVVRETL